MGRNDRILLQLFLKKIENMTGYFSRSEYRSVEGTFMGVLMNLAVLRKAVYGEVS
jgi:hypothetical protein